jgi:DNA-binding transcriptional ArsR family regulator
MAARKQKQVHVVKDLDQMEAMVSPIRHQVMRTLSALGLASIKEVAAQLERSPESLYYHFRALESVELMISAGSREVNGKPEALYSTVAQRIVTDAKARSPEYLDSLQRAASALLRLADRQLATELEHQKNAHTTRSVSFRIQQRNSRLKPAAAAKLAAMLDDVMSFLQENNSEDGEMISLTLSSAPIGSAGSR